MEQIGSSRSHFDAQLAALSHVKRRRLLMALLEEGSEAVDPVEVGDPAGGAERRKLHIEMHHRHLPKLEAHGYVRWDRDGDVVSRGPAFGDVRPLLELLDEHRDELPADWL